MHYEEEILCYIKTCFVFADVKKSIFQFSCDLELLVSSTKDTLRNIRKSKQIPCYKGNWFAWLCRKSVSDRTFLVSTVARLQNERSGVWIPAEARYCTYLFPSTVRLALGLTQPPFRWVPWDLSSWVKWLEREADHSPHLVPKSRKTGALHWLFIYVYMACSGTNFNSCFPLFMATPPKPKDSGHYAVTLHSTRLII
jgi:hypothetical protein